MLGPSALPAHGGHGLGHLLALLLGALVRGGGADLQQLDDAALVGREADDLADHLADQGVALALAALHLRGLLRHLPARDDEALVEARGQAGALGLRRLHHLAHLAPASVARFTAAGRNWLLPATMA